jgi:tetratricopeptide (TPR) repeat protein
MATEVETIAAVPVSAAGVAGHAEPAGNKGPWIYSAWLDLLVGCGAWSAPLLLFAALLTPSHAHAWAIAFYALATVFNYPHFMATEYRAYRSREDFQKYKLFTLHLTLLLALTGVLAHAFPRLVPWIFTLYICWSPWHYTGQNYGLLLMFVGRAGASIETAERRWLRAAFVASYLMLLASFETGGSSDRLILSLGLPAKLTIPLRAALGLAFAICAAAAFRALLRRSGWRVMIAPLTLLFTQFLWFVLPTLIELGSAYQIPQTRYSSGILAILHSAQYLWITSYYQRRDARAAGQSSWRMGGYFIALIAGGIALFIPGPWLVSYIFHFDFTTTFLIFTALVNIHHFLLDGAIWKLRDSRVASRLIAQPAGAPPADNGAKSAASRAPSNKPHPQAAWQKLVNRILGSPAFRVAVVALLFLWGVTDQVRFALGTDTGNIAALSRAARMNPYDSAVDERMASLEMASGKPADAIDLLSHAVAMNPDVESSEQNLARALIQEGRYSDAYEHYQKMLALFPRDADAFLNYGVLAAQLGYTDEAVDAWQRCLAVDSTQIEAHTYLAMAFDQRGDFKSAAEHWYAFLELAVAQQDIKSAGSVNDRKISPAQELSALVQLSDDEVRLNRPSAAVTGYSSAASLAQRLGNGKLASLALERLGDVQEKAGDLKSAAGSYQRALAWDEKGADPTGAASDWFNYGEFLQKNGKGDALVYACFLKAENLLGNSGGPELQTIRSAREQIESRLGKAAADARKNQSALLAKAESAQF